MQQQKRPKSRLEKKMNSISLVLCYVLCVLCWWKVWCFYCLEKMGSCCPPTITCVDTGYCLNYDREVCVSVGSQVLCSLVGWKRVYRCCDERLNIHCMLGLQMTCLDAVSKIAALLSPYRCHKVIIIICIKPLDTTSPASHHAEFIVKLFFLLTSDMRHLGSIQATFHRSKLSLFCWDVKIRQFCE